MSDTADAGAPDGQDGAGAGSEGAVPAMPAIRAREKASDYPYPVLDGLPRTIGWQWLADAKGGPAFVLISRGAMGGLKVLKRFPLTEDGWRGAWQALAAADPAAAAKVAVRLRARQAEDAGLPGQPAVADTQPILIVTTNEVPGFRITAVHGDVFGLVVRARTAFSNLGSSFQMIAGGELSGYTQLLTDSRNQARERMWREARARGANAIVAMRFDCNEIGNVLSEVAAYGTAVTVMPLDAPAGS